MKAISQLPFLTQPEFNVACELFAGEAHRYEHLQVTLERSYDINNEPLAYLNIRRLLMNVQLTEHEEYSLDDEFQHDEEDDEALMRSVAIPTQRPAVNYEIHLSPIYRVPVLYVSLLNMPNDEMSIIDQVYTFVVPETCKAPLLEAGVMGGLSYTDHPLTSMPALFVHPCRTAAAIAELSTSLVIDLASYLPFWLGIIGVSFGLHIPHESSAK